MVNEVQNQSTNQSNNVISAQSPLLIKIKKVACACLDLLRCYLINLSTLGYLAMRGKTTIHLLNESINAHKTIKEQLSLETIQQMNYGEIEALLEKLEIFKARKLDIPTSFSFDFRFFLGNAATLGLWGAYSLYQQEAELITLTGIRNKQEIASSEEQASAYKAIDLRIQQLLEEKKNEISCEEEGRINEIKENSSKLDLELLEQKEKLKKLTGRMEQLKNHSIKGLLGLVPPPFSDIFEITPEVDPRFIPGETFQENSDEFIRYHSSKDVSDLYSRAAKHILKKFDSNIYGKEGEKKIIQALTWGFSTDIKISITEELLKNLCRHLVLDLILNGELETNSSGPFLKICPILTVKDSCLQNVVSSSSSKIQLLTIETLPGEWTSPQLLIKSGTYPVSIKLMLQRLSYDDHWRFQQRTFDTFITEKSDEQSSSPLLVKEIKRQVIAIADVVFPKIRDILHSAVETFEKEINKSE